MTDSIIDETTPVPDQPPIRVAVAQEHLPAGAVEQNLATVERAIRRAGEAGADLLVLPELALTGYFTEPGIEQLAEPIAGPSIAAVRAAAAANGVMVCLGHAELDEATDRRFNTSVLIDKDGAVLARHRKTHLWGRENDRFSRADDPVTMVEVAGIRIGLLICYEVEFPELVRRLAVAGADLILVPTAVTDLGTSTGFTQQIVGARATENNIFIAYANHAGVIDGDPALGHSIIAGPLCRTVAIADADPAFLLAELDPDELLAGRSDLPYLRDRRPELY